MNQSRSYSGCGGTGARTGPGSTLAASAAPGRSRKRSLERALARGGLLRHVLRVARAVQVAVDVDVRLERERGVEHRLDPLHADLVDRLLDAVRVRRGVLDDVAAGHLVEAREQLVVLGEVGVAEHVRRHQGVLGERVAVHQEGVARVAGEHHLEDACEWPMLWRTSWWM